MIDFSFLDSIKGDLYKFIGILILFELTLTFFDFLKKAADSRLEKKFYKSLSDAEKKYVRGCFDVRLRKYCRQCLSAMGQCIRGFRLVYS